MILEYEKLGTLFEEQGLLLDEEIYDYFETYADVLVEWNKRMNLTAITDPYGIAVKHFLDSVMPFKYVDIPNGASLVDVGSGAGFPAVPMKIYRRDLNVTLCDSITKRITFLQNLSEELSLPMNIVNARAEAINKKPEFAGKYDFVTARAVARLPILCKYCLPFVKNGGKFIALKGPNEDVNDAASEIKKYGGVISDLHFYKLGGDKRQLIIIDKVQ